MNVPGVCVALSNFDVLHNEHFQFQNLNFLKEIDFRGFLLNLHLRYKYISFPLTGPSHLLATDQLFKSFCPGAFLADSCYLTQRSLPPR